MREWWSTKSENDEEYSYGALVVGNVDNDSSGLGISSQLVSTTFVEQFCVANLFSFAAKIVTGSLHGTLRVYYPTQNEFKIEHLLLEENLGEPILQIELGYFIPYVIV